MTRLIGGGIEIDGFLATNADAGIYQVSLRAGETYDFWLAPDDLSGGDDISDAYLELSGPGGGLPIADDNSAEDLNANLIYTADVTGTYTVTVREVTASGDGGDFVLSFVNRSLDDDVADHTFFNDATGGIGGGATIEAVGTNSALNVGDVFHSDINVDRIVDFDNDLDFVAVFLEGNGGVGGNVYTIDLRGFPTDDGTLFDPLLTVLDSDGFFVADNDDIAIDEFNSQVVIDPDVDGIGTGWYFLVAGSSPNAGGTYELQVTSSGGPEDVPGNDTSPFNVPLDGAVEGTVDIAGDEDWYGINLVPGLTYRFTVEGVSLNGPVELLLRDDDDGDAIEMSASGSQSATFDFTPGAGDGGLRFLDVHGDTGVETGSFKLSVALLSPRPAPVHQLTALDEAGVIGSNFADNITGSPGDDDIGGHLGNDTVAGGDGSDFLVGGLITDLVQPTGDDSLSGDAGDDFIEGEDGNDTLDGGDGDDDVDGDTGADRLSGGDGNDFVDGGLGDDASDTVDGGSGDDTLFGAGGTDTVTGGDGDDIMSGEDGDDTMSGGQGNDTIDGGGGTNQLNGGIGNDTFENVDGGDNVTAGAGVDHIQSLIGWTLDTDEENLTLIGGAAVNGNGNAGANVIFGNNGSNQLQGLGGSDTVNGGAGSDTLIGGAGKDLNTGSGGLDHIKFNALSESGTTFATRDAINTFAHGDKIDLSAIDANSNVAGNQAFVFSTAQALTGLSGLLIAQRVATNSFLVLADVNGDHVADFSLNVYTAPGFGTFQSWDFIL